MSNGIPPVASGAENSRINFALGVLSYAGWPVTEGNIKALVTWMQKENTGAGYNPLATTHPMTGAGFWNYIGEGKNYGVRNYTSFEQGVQATVETILNGNYENIKEGFEKAFAEVKILIDDIISGERQSRLYQRTRERWR